MQNADIKIFYAFVSRWFMQQYLVIQSADSEDLDWLQSPVTIFSSYNPFNNQLK